MFRAVPGGSALIVFRTVARRAGIEAAIAVLVEGHETREATGPVSADALVRTSVAVCVDRILLVGASRYRQTAARFRRHADASAVGTTGSRIAVVTRIVNALEIVRAGEPGKPAAELSTSVGTPIVVRIDGDGTRDAED